MKSKEDSAHILAAPPLFFIIPLLIGAIVEYFIPTSLLPTLPSIIIGLLFSWASLPFYNNLIKIILQSKDYF